MSTLGVRWTHFGKISMLTFLKITVYYYVRVCVCVCVCVCVLQMRVLRSDFARYNVAEDDERDMDEEDIGWKVVQSDVFRFPSHKSLLCAILGE